MPKLVDMITRVKCKRDGKVGSITTNDKLYVRVKYDNSDVVWYPTHRVYDFIEVID